MEHRVGSSACPRGGEEDFPHLAEIANRADGRGNELREEGELKASSELGLQTGLLGSPTFGPKSLVASHCPFFFFFFRKKEA
jgi:hypothetical protein